MIELLVGNYPDVDICVAVSRALQAFYDFLIRSRVGHDFHIAGKNDKFRIPLSDIKKIKHGARIRFCKYYVSPHKHA